MNNFKTAFDEIMGGMDYRTIERSMVYVTQLRDTGRVTVTEFSGFERDLVEKRARLALEQTDPYRSPCLGNIHEVGGRWAVQLTTYSLD